MEVRTIDNGKGKLSLKVCYSEEPSFNVASVIVYGEKDAVLIDTQWTRANAYRVCAEICELQKDLKTIFVTHAHPDHYFGTAYISEQFPTALRIAPAQTCNVMNTQFHDKIDHWTEVIGWQNVCTKSVEMSPLPADNKIMLEGEEIIIYPECMGDLKYNSLVWIPSVKTVYGSDILFNEAHPFTCEVSKAERKKWMEDLDLIDSLHPEVIIPGHARPGLPFNHSSVDYMRQYLIDTEDLVDNAKSSEEFFYEMCKRYPTSTLVMLSNEMNANVFKGGREWDWREEDDKIS